MPYFRQELGKIIEQGYDIGLDKYPIFDTDIPGFNEGYRQVLNNKIIDHYYTWEIGMNAGMFIPKLNIKMNEIMPLYNQMYLAQRDLKDPFITVDVETTSITDAKSDRDDKTNTSNVANAGSTDKTDSTSRSLFSNTPMTQLKGNEDYATNLTDANSKAESNSSTYQDAKTINEYVGSDKALTNYIARQKGFSGTKASLFREYIDSLINIDMMVITELDGLFFGLYQPDVGYNQFGLIEEPPYPPFNEGWFRYEL